MHEGNFTHEIVNSILLELNRHPDVKPSRVKVRVGEMLHLMPDSVRTHYEIMTKGTVLENVALDLEEIPVKVRCRTCGREDGVEDHHLPMCQHCDSLDVELIGGQAVWIDSIEAAPLKSQRRKK